ncbi:tyrosine-protein kinase Fer isoform X2 [Plutella xylostella]|uniref:tyrosine-protein kinase Fer isoform X1 n=1 Tax=Plutella xylostella TaxID=51655 RepID=UPI002032C638|nr:tyrosine-protein kinase Fer isoform X1 [Plutella xylostella]XP_048477901.1 tyrosine-protein kinase Fer isoform X2 [Plutella xylostella]
MGYAGVGAGGRAAHEALLARQDAELRLMETMKRSLTAKMKSDREYALALSAAAAHGQKMDKCEELSGSVIASAWRTMTEEWENTSKLIRANAEALESRALDRLASLMAERRKARKVYQEDHSKINSQFTQLSEEVSRKQSEYQKCLESYKQMRAKFEENYLKCPTSRGGRKLDETRDKYGKACRRLHRAHNEYVLLLAEATECERALRGAALPALHEQQRRSGEATATSWRGILLEVAQRTDLSGDKFREIQSKIEASIQNLRPQDEYREFLDKYKSPPSSPVSFAFDESLVEDTSGKLQPNQLTVDNLTVEWLKEKLTELETNLQDNREKQAALQGPEIIGNGVCKNNNTTLTNGGMNGIDRHSPPPLPLTISEPIKLLELRVAERKCAKQAEMIRSALAELGCEEAPSGCPDLSAEAVGVDSLDGSSPDHQDRSSIGSKASLDTLRLHLHSIIPPKPFFRLFSRPFRRKSVPSSPALPPKTFRSSSEGPKDPVSVSETERTLVEQEWFHGVLPREEVVRLLRSDGDYLVRETTRNQARQLVLSVCWGQHKHFIVQTTPEGHYRFEGAAFPSVAELIAWQRTSGVPVTARSGALLRRAVPRENWELNNDDVQLCDKIGRGNFGDVYKARLKTTNQEVAVKTCRVALPEEQKRTFLQEGRILKQYQHPNIVRLIGIAVQKQPIMIVMELVSGGSLLTFLRTRSNTLNSRSLTAMCRDAAAGMRYLESKNCIHRDLAARNCLVGDDNIVKISDFGMSREEEEYIVSGGMKQIPIKWTAPEALNFGKYTSLCDVWSYGVLVWEIFSKGDTPYAGMSNSRAREKIDTGYRMPAPENCPEEVYALMLRCWEYEPDKRPHFHQIYTIIDNIHNR